MRPVFDGHNDTLLRLWRHDRSGGQFINGGHGHIDLPKAKAGGFVGGLFATFVPPGNASVTAANTASDGTVTAPAVGAISQEEAMRVTMGQLAVAYRLERMGAVAICRTMDDIERARAGEKLAMVLHSEGAEAIGPDLDELEVLYAAGLRSLGLVWSRPTIFAHGVPFRFPSSPDIGHGLTDLGVALVKACNELGIMVDVSHLNEKGFWDVARVSRAPLVATHSNAHAICPVSRNLTDAQLDAVRDTGGVVGLNFATFFLRPDGKRTTDTPLSVMIRQLEHLLKKLGPDGVALGSDFDGALVPQDLGNAAGLPRLIDAMEAAGFGSRIIDNITHKNWLRVLSQTWR